MVTARYTFPDLAHVEALIEDHAQQYRLWLNPADYPTALAWIARRDELVAYRDAEQAKVGDLLCSRCHGTGRLIQFTHRFNGTCFQCKGDGWSARARGRKTAIR